MMFFLMSFSVSSRDGVAAVSAHESSHRVSRCPLRIKYVLLHHISLRGDNLGKRVRAENTSFHIEENSSFKS